MVITVLQHNNVALRMWCITYTVVSVVATMPSPAQVSSNNSTSNSVSGNKISEDIQQALEMLLSSDVQRQLEGVNKVDTLNPKLRSPSPGGEILLPHLYRLLNNTTEPLYQVKITYIIGMYEKNWGAPSPRKALRSSLHPAACCNIAVHLVNERELRREDANLVVEACIDCAANYKSYGSLCIYIPPTVPMQIVKSMADQAELARPVVVGNGIAKDQADFIRQWWAQNKEEILSKLSSIDELLINFPDHRIKLERKKAMEKIDSLLSASNPEEQRKGIYLVADAGDQLAGSGYIQKLEELSEKSPNMNVRNDSITVLMRYAREDVNVRNNLYRQLVSAKDPDIACRIALYLFQDPRDDEMDDIVVGIANGFDRINSEQRNKLDKNQIASLDDLKQQMVELINAQARKYSVTPISGSADNQSHDNMSQKVKEWWKANKSQMIANIHPSTSFANKSSSSVSQRSVGAVTTRCVTTTTRIMRPAGEPPTSQPTSLPSPAPNDPKDMQ